jgi:uncharacterized protein YqeY
MSILDEKLHEDLKASLKAGDQDRINALRFLISQIQYADKEKGETLSDEDVLAVLAKQAKSRREAIEAFQVGGREDLVEKELKDLAIVESYLPEQLGEDEIRESIRGIIRDEEISGPSDMGRLMKSAMALLKGKADGKVVNRIAGEELHREQD